MAFNNGSRTLLLRGAKQFSAPRTHVVCESCLSRPAAFTPRVNTPRTPLRLASVKISRTHKDGARKSPHELRAEIDKRDRSSYYILVHSENLITMAPGIAESIASDVLRSNFKSDSPELALYLVGKHPELKLEDLTNLAIATYRIPDKKDKSGKLPAGQHKDIAKRLLLSCTKAKEPNALLHIMSAVHLAHSNPIAKEIASHFSSVEIRSCRQQLDELVSEDHADAKTLLGQFLEREGQERAARRLYTEALEAKKAKAKNEDEEVHPMALPRAAPWNALGTLLLAAKEAEFQSQARDAFEYGALKCDDPVAYYHLASFLDHGSGKWLQYMHKAAAAGHLDAMFGLGHFYMTVNSEGSGKVGKSLLKDRLVTKSLWWLTEWKENSPRKLALEWFGVAASGGHKPSMLELADYAEMEGHNESAIEWLQTMTEPPSLGEVEKWPLLAADAKRRLTKLRRLSHSLG